MLRKHHSPRKSHAIAAQVTVGDDKARGVIVAHGKPVYCYNLFGAQRFKVHGAKAVESGEHQIRAEFDYDGGGLAKGGTVTLYIDGESVGEGRVDATQPLIFSTDEITDLGSDTATSVTDDFRSAETKFTGRVQWVQIDVGEDADDADHYITTEERLRIAMAIQ